MDGASDNLSFFQITMFLVQVNDFTFSSYYESTEQQLLIIGDSLLRKFNMSQTDKLFFPGARADDVAAILQLPQIRRIIQKYTTICLFYGGNAVNDFPKQGILRRAQTPSEVMFDVHYVCEALSQKHTTIFILGCPLRLNGTADRIKELNLLLKNIPTNAKYVSLSSKMATEYSVHEDEVHLSCLGITYLRSIILHRFLKKIE